MSTQISIPPPYFGNLTYIKIYNELLGTLVTVKLSTGKTLEGYLYNVDPVTFTIILLQAENFDTDSPLSGYKVLVVMSHAVAEFKVNDEVEAIPRHLLDSIVAKKVEDYSIDSEKMRQRKERLISLFTSATNDSTIHIMDCAHIAPPYVDSSVECENEIVLKRVKDMMTQLPALE
ncbi:11678_t:CDS:2 [Acaulospora morrowiae]|uniref:11678_t:CDS:1 n=1 Tax=Acaulospora morrowiae TaxID=94023 RepID=A0A9N9C0R3_9GLOM|nr:11678_t:CDS:2 [Acaulospora morrowiae]